MSNPEQEKSLAVISGIAHNLSKADLSAVQLDQLQIAEHLLTNISVQLQIEASLRAANQPVTPKVEVPVFQVSEPCQVLIYADRVQHEHWERATITGAEARTGVEGGWVYKTSKTGSAWVTPGRLNKVRK